jgi:Ig-like domain from next to BRCA1 gene
VAIRSHTLEEVSGVERSGRVRVRRRSTAVVVAIALVGAACTGTDLPTDDSSSETTDDAAGETTDESTPAAGDRDDVDTRRAGFPGVTFEHPADWMPRDDGTANGDGSVVVTLDGPDGDPVATLRITTVRTADGRLLDGLDAYLLDALSIVEQGASDGSSVASGFVNGAGVRTIDGSKFRFVGTTEGGGHVVELDAADVSDARIEQLDALIGSLFVDGAAESLSVRDCEHDVKVVSEVTVDGGTEVAPGALVTARWTVENTGGCTWTLLDAWVFAGGDALEFIEASDLDGVAPGEQREVSVTFRAPAMPGSYSAQWQFMPGGTLELVGPPVAVSILVV